MFTFLFVTFHNLLAPTKSQDLLGSSKIYTQTHTHAGKHVNAHTSGSISDYSWCIEALNSINICSEAQLHLSDCLFFLRLYSVDWPNEQEAACRNIKWQPCSVTVWLTLGDIRGGTGEHTFPGRLAAQGCREPAVKRVTLVKLEQTESDLERQRCSRIWLSKSWKT